MKSFCIIVVSRVFFKTHGHTIIVLDVTITYWPNHRVEVDKLLLITKYSCKFNINR